MRYLGWDGTVFMWYLGQDGFFTVFFVLLIGTVVKNANGKTVAPGISLNFIFCQKKS